MTDSDPTSEEKEDLTPEGRVGPENLRSESEQEAPQEEQGDEEEQQEDTESSSE